MRKFFQEYGGTILVVAVLVILLAPYLGIRYGTEPPPQPTVELESAIRDNSPQEHSLDFDTPSERSQGSSSATQATDQKPRSSDASLGEIEALLNK